MFWSLKKTSINEVFQKNLQWIRENSIGGGIAHSSEIREPYPEVTGYYIPSLLNWGEKQLAFSYGDWLISIQTEVGGWQDTALKTLYTFDTGQILKGLYELAILDQKYEAALLKGCHWLWQQIDQEGGHTPSTALFSPAGKEYIHLYALEPLQKIGEKYNKSEYVEAVQRALQYYLAKEDLIEFDCLSHFHAYIVEALIDLGKTEKALDALKKIEIYQHRDGGIPAYNNVRWRCLVAMFQYAVCYYKLGMLTEGNRLFDYVIKYQQPTGGFFGGNGLFVKYFKNIEIGWTNKYFLDALRLKLRLEFSQTKRAESFVEKLDLEDGRYLLLKELILKNSVQSILDVGCGKGRYINNLHNDKILLDITAVDVSDKLFHYLPPNCQKKIGEILKIPVENDAYDFVLCCEVLEHCINIKAAVAELYRVVKKNGIVLIIDKDIRGRRGMILEPWEQWFDIQELKLLLESEGFFVETKEVFANDGSSQYAWIGRKI